MRALRRFRALAAVSALLLFLAGSALAGVPDRPIDSPEGPMPKPVQVGDPDQPSGYVVAIGYWLFTIELDFKSGRARVIQSGGTPGKPWTFRTNAWSRSNAR
jgi:hypothetical protein